MSAKLIKLAERRGTLISRAAAQRVELAQAFVPWHRPLAVVDQGISAVRYLGRHPVALGGIVACAIILRPERMYGWIRNGWLAWRMVTAVKRSALLKGRAKTT